MAAALHALSRPCSSDASPPAAFNALPLPPKQVRWQTNVRNGVCGVAFDRRDIPMNKFTVTCLEAQFHAFEARTQHAKKARAGCALGGGF